MHRLLIKVIVNMKMIFHDFLFRILDLLSTGVQIPRSQSWRPRLPSNNSFGPIELLYIPDDCDHLKPPVRSSFLIEKKYLPIKISFLSGPATSAPLST